MRTRSTWLVIAALAAGVVLRVRQLARSNGTTADTFPLSASSVIDPRLACGEGPHAMVPPDFP